MAVAWHPDVNDVWVIWDADASIEAVKAEVLSVCNRMMPSGCAVAASGFGGTAVITKDQFGFLSTTWNNKADVASKAALRYCADDKKQCTVFRSFTSKPWRKFFNEKQPDRKKFHFPTMASAFPQIAAVAWPATVPASEQWLGKSWLATGNKLKSAVERALVDRCRKDSGTQCVMGPISIGGLLVRYTTDQNPNKILWTAVPSRATAEATIRKHCAVTTDGARCAIVDFYDSADDAMTIISQHPQ